MFQARRMTRPGSFFLVLFAALAVFLPGPLFAQSVDPFTVRNVQVDISADNVSVARDRALADGQRQALDLLLQRLTAPADWSRLPKLSGSDIDNAVLDVGIDHEKRSTVRYLATLSVRFKPDAIRRLLRGANIAYAEWRGRPVAVLPVFQADGTPQLSEPANPWREAWRGGAAQGIVPMIVPTAEQLDGVTTAQQAASAGPEVLAAVAQRFNTQDVLVAVATQQRLDGGKVKVDVVLTGTGPIGGGLAGTRSYDGQAGETLDMVLRRAVEDVAKTANDNWKGGNLLQFDHQASLAVMVPISGFEDWLAVRDRLTRSTPVRSYEVAAISRSEAALVLHYVGEQPQLEQVFAQNGLALSWASDHWILQTSAGRSNAGAR
ncbi:DUF2066 domain-containing protein [Telmatospirillum sp.]|uniref:DUF2066 domain-containing protein n=1 Tax=Telmatospirillum sp. TaxID=2079197 RepID=UPI0028493716|nr:DUF2066 domain-containing protein [Telmatospirillum sp.]MDR3438445.1 DUF2066 domain-containing protein [Telmatospirillum sp.]